MEIVDIAGLVRGASKGAGLGNQFLGNIREVSVVLHALRCFRDEDVVHVENSVDPLRDWDIVQTELLLADLQLVEKRLDTVHFAAAAAVSAAAAAALSLLPARSQKLLTLSDAGSAQS